MSLPLTLIGAQPWQASYSRQIDELNTCRLSRHEARLIFITIINNPSRFSIRHGTWLLIN